MPPLGRRPPIAADAVIGGTDRRQRDSTSRLSHEHATFEAYCNERWGWSRDYGYKLIRATTAVLNGDVDRGLQTEREVREAMRVHYSSESEWYTPNEVVERGGGARRLSLAGGRRRRGTGPTPSHVTPALLLGGQIAGGGSLHHA